MVQIKIDQAAHPPGVAGIAREDLATGSDITLTATGGPYLQYLWRIINKPLDVLTSTRASSLLTAPDAPVTLLSPIDVAGTYLIEVSVDSGLGLGAGIEDVARITFYAGPTLATAPNSLPRREPAIGETTQHNVAGNDEGWGAELRKWFALIRSLAGASKVWASAMVETTSTPPTVVNIVRGTPNVGVTPSDPGGDPTYDITFTPPMPDANYGVLLSPINFSGNTTTNGYTISNKVAGGFRVVFTEVDPLFTGVFAIASNFYFEVKLGVAP